MHKSIRSILLMQMSFSVLSVIRALIQSQIQCTIYNSHLSQLTYHFVHCSAVIVKHTSPGLKWKCLLSEFNDGHSVNRAVTLFCLECSLGKPQPPLLDPDITLFCSLPAVASFRAPLSTYARRFIIHQRKHDHSAQ